MAAEYGGDWEPEADYTGHQWFTVSKLAPPINDWTDRICLSQNLPPKAKVSGWVSDLRS